MSPKKWRLDYRFLGLSVQKNYKKKPRLSNSGTANPRGVFPPGESSIYRSNPIIYNANALLLRRGFTKMGRLRFLEHYRNS